MFDDVKYIFHDDLHDRFLCAIPTLLFKLLIDKGVAHLKSIYVSIGIKGRETMKNLLKNTSGNTSLENEYTFGNRPLRPRLSQVSDGGYLTMRFE